MSPPLSPQQQTAKKLVTISHALGWGGLGLLIFGPIVGFAALHSGKVAAAGAIVGALCAFGGAIVGQVGRGMQGRVI